MTRPHLYLPHISEPDFDPRAAKQDRILMDVTGWRLIATLDQFHEFGRRLAEPIPFSEGEHRLFRVMSRQPPNLPEWKMLGGQDTGLRVPMGKPLVKGDLRGFLKGVQHGARPMTWELRARLALNPTRWLRSQLRSLRRELDPERWLDVPAIMFADDTQFDLHDEVPIVRGTNVLISPRILSLGRPEVWPVQLRRYRQAALQLIRDALTHAAMASGATVELNATRYILREVETYWELQTDRPIEAVEELERPLRSLVSKSAVRWRQVSPDAKPKFQVGSKENSPVLRLKVAAGTDVRIYAKTTRRVRFEVLRRTKEIRDSFTSGEAEEFFVWLDQAAQHASERLEQLIGTFGRLTARLPAQQIPSFRLMTDMYSLVGGQALSLISQLAAQGQVVRTEATGSAIDRLKAEGILERVQQTERDHIYHVTSKYQGGLALIRSWS